MPNGIRGIKASAPDVIKIHRECANTMTIIANDCVTGELFAQSVRTTGAESAFWRNVAEVHTLHGAERALGWVGGWWYVTGNSHSWSNAAWKRARIILGESHVL